MLKKLTIILLGFIAASTVRAQDPEFSQFYAAPLYLNPGFTGTAGGPRIMLNYRNQWPGVNNAYEHYAAAYDQNVNFLGGGVGLLFTNDKQADGVFSATNVSGLYSYQLRVNDDLVIRPGVGVTYMQKSLDGTNLIYKYDNAGQKEFTADDGKGGDVKFVDFSAGVLAFSERYFGGLAVDHLTEPDQKYISGPSGDSKLPMKVSAHVGSMIPVGNRSSNASISPNLLFQQQAAFRQLNGGLYYNRGPIVIGGWYRHAFSNGDAFIALIGVKQGIFKAGYSYDVVTSELRTAAAGAHEISLSVEFAQPKKRAKGKQYQRINCPAF